MIRLIKCEFYKLISLKTFIVAFFMPLIMVIIGLINVYRGIFPVTDMLDAIYNQSSILYGGIVLPISIIIIVALQWRVEYKNENILLLCSSPVKLASIYLSKAITTTIIVFINIVMYILVMLLFSTLLLAKGAMPSYFLYAPLIGMIFSILLISIQHLLSMYSRNFIVPIGVGIIVVLGGFLLNSTRVGVLIPTLYIYYGLFFSVPQTGYTNIDVLFIIVPALTILVQLFGSMLFKRIEK